MSAITWAQTTVSHIFWSYKLQYRKWVWGCAALMAPFSCLSCSSHFSQKCKFTRPPFEEILASTTSNFAKILAFKSPNLEIFSSQAPKFWTFQFTSPQIWKFSVHKPPPSEPNINSQAPHFGNPGCTPLPEKSWVSPSPRISYLSIHKAYILSSIWLGISLKLCPKSFILCRFLQQILKQISAHPKWFT